MIQTVTHAGAEIAYTVTGQGPTIVLQHGLLSSAASWSAAGYVQAFSDAYRVICIDSLGHGESDKPKDAARYAKALRAGDVVAVLDANDVERAHYVGYSMGGWIGTAMAIYHADRLASLTIGGWDPVGGSGPADLRPDFDTFFRMAGAAAPHLVGWVTEDARPGLSACWDALLDTQGSEAALLALDAPVLYWAGEEDQCYDAMRVAAERHETLEFLSVPGDHVAARMKYVAESTAGLRAFVDKA